MLTTPGLALRSNIPESGSEAARLLEMAGLKGPPVADLGELARMRGVAKVVESADLRAQGLTYPTDEGLVIKVSATLSFARRRFTLAHEIGHTYFYASPTKAGARRQHESGVTFSREEGWCNNFAGDLLMPGGWLRRDTAIVGDPSISVLMNLVARYEVSVEALLLQLARLRAWPTLAICSQPRAGNVVVRKILTFGVVKHSGTRRGVAIPRDSSVARAARTAELAVGEETWLSPVLKESRPQTGRYLMESQAISKNFVLTLVHIEPKEASRNRLEAAMREQSRSMLFPT